MKIYKVENILKTHGEKTLFSDINFSIATEDKVGLIGINGTGKSSLLKCMAGLDSFDKEDIIHPNDYTISYLSQDIDLDEEMSVIDAVFQSESKIMKLLKKYELAIVDLENDPENEAKQKKLLLLQEEMEYAKAWDLSSSVKIILSKLGIKEYDRKIKELSGGEKKRVALAKVLIEMPDLLLLDEPTNHLDFETIEWLEKYLKSYPNSILVITHDRYFLDNISTRIFELNKGRLFEYSGNYSSFLLKKTERETNEISQYNKNMKMYKQELEWIRRGAKARTTKQQARIDKFEKLEEKLENRVQEEILNIELGGSRLGKQVFEIEKISKKYYDKVILDDFSIIVQKDARIGIIGINGVGKTTLLNILSGNEKIDSGTIKVGQTVKIAYYSQFNDDMDMNLRMINYIRQGAESIKTSEGNKISATQLLERFLFPLHSHGTILSKLSGGERRRLYLLRLLMQEPNVLILDEPTNDLDTETLTILEDYLKSFSGAVITVSHDRYFLDKTVNELLVFKGQGKIEKFIGNYTEYIEAGNTIKEEKVKEISKEVIVKKKTSKIKFTYNERKEWENIDSEIEKLENKISELENLMVEYSTDFEMISKFTKEREVVKIQLENKLERWEYLASIAEQQ
ncbi:MULTISPECIES: ABC-F family ATP-binding cassette domain-containing protein [unclassified Gemella]|uniref:ABC-F family ATP-binding cassette domain-containing protein n=1 Tax=unclassified Gemella TaxID=2624949 RepID=UPI00107327FC|nr:MULTISPECIES: ABC-F family ATP-binding cassette domain-containing protein [unclassified Gemella]MBF0710111.1 ABC-F family ATP-binding cassette domain-containing protein [Gemella sp. GL1.1]MBF0746190.1 ABC-F family ATP-binding cassette domain-containing protein [Gemella sp. 19428wG2_WT2a]NYS27455.1 ABC-F family ATP-binding cassette domain-containing protein [Gemella sp. GL1]TFU60475.1 ABC transporter ATP-binding protein [Gemella sp. WT2a]